jgi:hypothetical protein
MKKNRVLHRVYVGFYFIWVFAGLMAPLLGMRLNGHGTSINGALSIVLLVFSSIDLALVIISQVFYSKKKELFPLFSLIAASLLSAIVLYGFIAEAVYAGLGESAIYPWVILSLSLIGIVFCDFYLGRDLLRLKKGLSETEPTK